MKVVCSRLLSNPSLEQVKFQISFLASPITQLSVFVICPLASHPQLLQFLLRYKAPWILNSPDREIYVCHFKEIFSFDPLAYKTCAPNLFLELWETEMGFPSKQKFHLIPIAIDMFHQYQLAWNVLLTWRKALEKWSDLPMWKPRRQQIYIPVPHQRGFFPAQYLSQALTL